jgi:hypothetical protein
LKRENRGRARRPAFYDEGRLLLRQEATVPRKGLGRRIHESCRVMTGAETRHIGLRPCEEVHTHAPEKAKRFPAAGSSRAALRASTAIHPASSTSRRRRSESVAPVLQEPGADEDGFNGSPQDEDEARSESVRRLEATGEALFWRTRLHDTPIAPISAESTERGPRDQQPRRQPNSRQDPNSRTVIAVAARCSAEVPLRLVDPHFQPGTRPACSIHLCISCPCASSRVFSLT